MTNSVQAQRIRELHAQKVRIEEELRELGFADFTDEERASGIVTMTYAEFDELQARANKP